MTISRSTTHYLLAYEIISLRVDRTGSDVTHDRLRSWGTGAAEQQPFEPGVQSIWLAVGHGGECRWSLGKAIDGYLYAPALNAKRWHLMTSHLSPGGEHSAPRLPNHCYPETDILAFILPLPCPFPPNISSVWRHRH